MPSNTFSAPDAAVQRNRRRSLFVIALLTCTSCTPRLPEQRLQFEAELPTGLRFETVPIPAASGATAYSLTTSWAGASNGDDGRLGLAWIEPPTADENTSTNTASTMQPATTVSSEEASGWRVMSSQWNGGWQAPERVVDGRPLFANWADRPRFLVGGSDRTSLTVWLERLGDGPYAYGLRAAARGPASQQESEPPPSTDAEETERSLWRLGGWLQDDTKPVEHGFVSFATSDDLVQTFWLDGRGMDDGGPMTLRTTAIADEQPVRPSRLLDDRVCECCPTDAAMTPDGPIVVYRDRSEDEIRDIASVRWMGDRWSAPAIVSRDQWRINGCPVNGPAVATSGDHVLVAWFTGAAPGARVQMALSNDRGASFSPTVTIDDEKPVGRVDLTIAGGLAWVSWLGRTVDGTALLLRPVAVRSPSSSPDPASVQDSSTEPVLVPGRAHTVALTSAARAAGVPQLASASGQPILVWAQLDDEAGRSLHSVIVSW